MEMMKTVSKLKKDLWTIFSKYIRLRDAIRTTGNCNSGICITCKKLIPIKWNDAGHGITRKCNATLFDERNVNLQCKACNGYGAGEQHLYMIEVDKIYGTGTAEDLQRIRHTTKRFSRPELLDMIEHYKAELKKLEDEFGSPW